MLVVTPKKSLGERLDSFFGSTDPVQDTGDLHGKQMKLRIYTLRCHARDRALQYDSHHK